MNKYIYIHMTISLHPFFINVLDSGSSIRQCPDQVFPALVGLYQTDVGLPHMLELLVAGNQELTGIMKRIDKEPHLRTKRCRAALCLISV